MSTRRILNLYKKSLSLPKSQQRDAKNWYKNANVFAIKLASDYGISVSKAAGVISALSPGISWETNKTDAEILIAGWSAGIYIDSQKQTHRFSTYWQNVEKAERILFADRPVHEFFSQVTALKTYHFYLNILHPTKDTGATIDRHAMAIWSGDGEAGRRKIHAALYKRVENDYKNAANKIGILPHELQAVTWVTYKQLNNL